MSVTTDKFNLYILDNSATILSNWRDKIFISKEDPSLNYIEKNGHMIILAILEIIQGDNGEELIMEHAQKIGEERAIVNSNIEEFVHNVNLGRSEIFSHLIRAELSFGEIQLFIDKLNKSFDHFIFYAIKQYTEVKEINVNKKTKYLEQSHKDRLTILGQISSSFVHEIRNPLTSVIGFTKLLKEEHISHPFLDIIFEEVQQMNKRINHFLYFSKENSSSIKQSQQVHLLSLISEIEEFLLPILASSTIQLKTIINPLLYLETNKDELRQVFLNILMNSIDAFRVNDTSRKIFVTVMSKNEEIVIKITNNGPPIVASQLTSIFEPFVTYKEEGTGLGLYITKQIVEKNSGTIQCQSNENRTTFIIKF
ncbi:GHKL domain-containing protein [Bacillus sp. BGMRC 2118]|nr:GHKL domain-containing protein [Bacillus sp. BGMRC 2118]